MTIETITSEITMDYSVDIIQVDKGDSMHPPEWKNTIHVEDITIDDEGIEEPLKGMLIEFMEKKIK